MVQTHKRLPRTIPFLLVFVVGLIVVGEYIFALLGTFQMHSALRGGVNTQYAENTQVLQLLEKKVNDTIKSLMVELQNKIVSDTRLVSLGERLSSLENTIENASDAEKESIKGGEFEKLQDTIARVAEQVQTHEEKVEMLGAESLLQRLSSIERRVYDLTNSRNERSAGKDAYIVPSTRGSKAPICVSWETDMDVWWTHHPDWYVSMENNTHYCFSLMEDPEKAAAFRKLYQIQFKGDCSHVVTKEMLSAGWGADFQHVTDGLLHAYQTGIPAQMHVVEGAWHCKYIW